MCVDQFAFGTFKGRARTNRLSKSVYLGWICHSSQMRPKLATSYMKYFNVNHGVDQKFEFRTSISIRFVHRRFRHVGKSGDSFSCRDAGLLQDERACSHRIRASVVLGWSNVFPLPRPKNNLRAGGNDLFFPISGPKNYLFILGKIVVPFWNWQISRQKPNVS